MKSWKVRRSTIAFAWRYAIRYRVVATTLRSALAELLSGNRRAQPLRKMGIDHSSRARGHSPRTLAGLAFREAACPVSSETCVLAGTTRRFTSRACRATSDRPRLGRVEACDPPARDRVALPCGRNSHRAHPVTGRLPVPGFSQDRQVLPKTLEFRLGPWVAFVEPLVLPSIPSLLATSWGVWGEEPRPPDSLALIRSVVLLV